MVAPSKTRYSTLLEKKEREDPKPRVAIEADQEDGEEDDEELSEISEELDDSDHEEDSDSDEIIGEAASDDNENAEADEAQVLEEEDQAPEVAEPVVRRRERKRKRKEDNEDLESKYLAELGESDDNEPEQKRPKAEEQNEEDDSEDNEKPVHESLAKDSKSSELDKANRTVFLSNVSSEAISNKAAKKTLLAHMSSIFKEESSKEKIESIRFRSVAYSTMAMPKRGAYATKALMGATTKATNAYVVYSTPAAARKACTELNGTEILDRHIRVDNVAHPSPTDHRRCVFVGNLGFVDDETIITTNPDGEKEEKKRTKIPADAEEGLWRVFSKHGKVENVRVIRDPITRVGKGFAYVQFYVSSSTNGLLTQPARLTNFYRMPTMSKPRSSLTAKSFLLCYLVSSA